MLESSRPSIPGPGTRLHLSNTEVGPHVAAEGLESWENLGRVNKFEGASGVPKAPQDRIVCRC